MLRDSRGRWGGCGKNLSWFWGGYAFIADRTPSSVKRVHCRWGRGRRTATGYRGKRTSSQVWGEMARRPSVDLFITGKRGGIISSDFPISPLIRTALPFLPYRFSDFRLRLFRVPLSNVCHS